MPHRQPDGESTGWWLLVLVLVALNLRTPIASIPPLADPIAADLGLSATGLGLLTTVPVLCMGLFAPVGPVASDRYGRGRVLAAAVALIALGTALRAVPQTAALFASAALAGIGIAVAGAVLPPLVRSRFPDRVGPVTGVYTAGLIGGAMFAAALAEPVRLWIGGAWSVALALWAAPAAVALVAWLAVTRPAPATGPAPSGLRSEATREGGASEGPGARASGASANIAAWRDRTAWYATVYMGGQSLLYYAALAWLAARYTAIGYPPAQAGLLLGVFSATQLVSALGLPALAHRTGALAASVAAATGLCSAALAAIGLAPTGAPWVWAVVLGLGAGGQFALALTLLGSLGRTAAESAAASGLAFFVGYLLAAVGPVAAGALHDLTGGYRVPFLALAVVGIFVLAAGVAAARATTLKPG